MPDFAYTEQTVYVHRDEDQGVYKFGLILDGTFVPFAWRKLGGIDDQIAQAKEAAAAAQQTSSGTTTAPPPAEPPTTPDQPEQATTPAEPEQTTG